MLGWAYKAVKALSLLQVYGQPVALRPTSPAPLLIAMPHVLARPSKGVGCGELPSQVATDRPKLHLSGKWQENGRLYPATTGDESEAICRNRRCVPVDHQHDACCWLA
jgi:hypothetical protein